MILDIFTMIFSPYKLNVFSVNVIKKEESGTWIIHPE